MKKRGGMVLVTALLMLFSLGLVSSGSVHLCSDLDDVMFRLHEPNNSHVATWYGVLYGDMNGDKKVNAFDALILNNTATLGDDSPYYDSIYGDPWKKRLADVDLDGDIDSDDALAVLQAAVGVHRLPLSGPSSTVEPIYSHEVCYSEVFGIVYPGNPRESFTSLDQVIFYADSTRNSHVASSYLDNPGYSSVIYYGDEGFVCSIEEDGSDSPVGSCSDPDARIVARMNSLRNSHAATADFDAYPYKVCCQYIQTSFPGTPVWKNLQGIPINESEVGDYVYMNWEDDSQSGSYDMEIYEDDDVSGDDFIRTINQGFEDGELNGLWKITLEDFEKGELGSEAEFKFTVPGLSQGLFSGLLLVDKEGDDDEFILDVSPACGDMFEKGDSINIVVTAVDGDDLIDGRVTIGDIGLTESFTNGGITIPHTFNTAGSFQIIAEANNTRGKTLRKISSIAVVDLGVEGSQYIASCIDKPEDAANIPGTSVDFDASGAKAWQVNSGFAELLGKERMYFHWRFSEGPGRDCRGNEGSCITFTREFATAGNNWATLEVEIV